MTTNTPKPANPVSIDQDDNANTADAAIKTARRAHVERLIAQASTTIREEVEMAIAAQAAPLAPENEAQFRQIARAAHDLEGLMNIAVGIAGKLRALAGTIDPEVERGMRLALDTMLLAVAVHDPQNQMNLIAKTELLGVLGPAEVKHVNLRPMLMAALEQDVIRAAQHDPAFKLTRTASVH